MNDWALITGASSGIGLELAKCFAEDGFNLALVARNESRLKEVAAESSAGRKIETKVFVRDLAAPTAPGEIFDALEGTPISVLVNNAGLGFYGAFASSNLDEQMQIMRVNMLALVELTHLFLHPMLARQSGRILNVASTAAFQPGPAVNVYFASKAFVYSFSYALAEELSGKVITVTALCPGTTRTDFFVRGRFGPMRTPFTMSARDVARIGYRGLMRGKRVVIPGWTNKLMSALAKRAPARITAGAVRRIHSGRNSDPKP